MRPAHSDSLEAILLHSAPARCARLITGDRCLANQRRAIGRGGVAAGRAKESHPNGPPLVGPRATLAYPSLPEALYLAPTSAYQAWACDVGIPQHRYICSQVVSVGEVLKGGRVCVRCGLISHEISFAWRLNEYANKAQGTSKSPSGTSTKDTHAPMCRTEAVGMRQ